MATAVKELIVKSQNDLDKISIDFEGTVYIEGGTEKIPLVFSRKLISAEVVTRGNAWLIMKNDAVVQSMWDSSSVLRMWGSSSVLRMGDSSSVQSMWGSSSVLRMGGSSSVQSMWDNSSVQSMGDGSSVQSMWDNSSVLRMWDNSSVLRMGDSSSVLRMGDSSSVQSMWDNSSVQSMWDSSSVLRMGDSSSVLRMGDSSSVQKLYGESMIGLAQGNNSITCEGYNIVRVRASNEKNLTLVMSVESHLIVIPDFVPSVDEYLKCYPVTKNNGKFILYKAVHKKKDKYVSDFSPTFKYEVGKVKKQNVAPATAGSCSEGIHVAHKDWAILFGSSWNDMALLECEVDPKKLVVSQDCDGKIRTSELKVLREVPREEW